MNPGGKGANQAVAASRLGAEVAFVGLTGPDAFGDDLRRSLVADRVDLSHAQVAEAVATGVALVTVNDEGEDTIAVATGANALLTPEDVAAAIGALRPTVVLASLEVPIEAVVATMGSLGFLIVNPAPAADLPAEFWPRIDLFTPNERETRFYTGIDPTDDEACVEAAARLFERGVRNVLFTLGPRGSFLATSPDDGRRLPNLEVRAVDTTGAGDAFNGAVAALIAAGRTLEEAALLANCVGALACTRSGAQNAMPTLAELREAVGDAF